MAESVIVIGAGVVGAAIARCLAEQGVRVTLLEKHLPASGASSKSFSWINANFPQSPEYFALRCRSIRIHHEWQQELKLDHAYSWQGSLWWEYAGDQFDQHVRRLAELEYKLEVIERSEFCRLEPGIIKPPDRSVLFPDEGAVDSALLTDALIQRAQNLGTTLVTGCDVHSITIRNNSVTGVSSSLGGFSADRVVLAVGCETQCLLDGIGIALPMENQPGLIVQTRPVQQPIARLILTPDIHFRQQTDGSILAAEDYGGGTIEEDPKAITSRIISTLKGYLPDELNLDIARVSLGIRPMPKDGFPAVGFVDDAEGLYIAAMHSGVTLAPIMGSLAAQEIIHGQYDPMLKPFRPGRLLPD